MKKQLALFLAIALFCMALAGCAPAQSPAAPTSGADSGDNSAGEVVHNPVSEPASSSNDITPQAEPAAPDENTLLAAEALTEQLLYQIVSRENIEQGWTQVSDEQIFWFIFTLPIDSTGDNHPYNHRWKVDETPVEAIYYARLSKGDAQRIAWEAFGVDALTYSSFEAADIYDAKKQEYAIPMEAGHGRMPAYEGKNMTSTINGTEIVVSFELINLFYGEGETENVASWGMYQAKYQSITEGAHSFLRFIEMVPITK